MQTKIKAYLILFIVSALFGGNVIASKVISSEMPSLGLAAIRAVLGLLILVPLAWPQLKNSPRPNRKEILQFFILGFFGITMAYVTFLVGIESSTATNASIIIATGPAVTNLLLFIFYKVKLTKFQVIGISASFIGLLVVFTQGTLKHIFTLNLGVGDLILLLNVLSIALFSILGQGITQKFSSLVTSVYAIALNTIILIPLGAWQLVTYDWQLSFSGWLIVIYMSFFVTGGAFFLFLYGISIIGGGQASIFSNLQPVISIILSVIILGETIATYHLIGFVLVISGIILSLSITHAFWSKPLAPHNPRRKREKTPKKFLSPRSFFRFAHRLTLFHSWKFVWIKSRVSLCSSFPLPLMEKGCPKVM